MSFEAELASTTFCMGCSACNPFIYAMFNDRYRERMGRMFGEAKAVFNASGRKIAGSSVGDKPTPPRKITDQTFVPIELAFGIGRKISNI
jgi:hypothetical protein